ncbi:hypothetical protein Mgra_00009764 [Meloidogyne graminicola]|uniref:Uncharacterized protein n=1 Tax=Meloidogyne graminicola TaxID=189291 RepID=A0A8S9Z6Z5_9BILA|nr:hypothetical protein Mgra_00009764 [Meloidogyne graminicola]
MFKQIFYLCTLLKTKQKIYLIIVFNHQMLIGQSTDFDKLTINNNKNFYKFLKLSELNKCAFGFFDIIEPIFSLNDWTSLSVICFGVCELQLRCRYSQHFQ